MAADVQLEDVLDELTAIKRLIIFALLQQPNVTQAQIATALGVAQSHISKMMSGKNG
jgi:predicted XRE-type DNA-binding protein